MTTTLIQALSNHLAGYLVHVDTWTVDDGDTFLMLNAREWLAAHAGELSDSQRRQLQVADTRVLALAETAYQDETDDVQFLRLVAGVINSSVKKAA